MSEICSGKILEESVWCFPLHITFPWDGRLAYQEKPDKHLLYLGKSNTW